MRIAARCWALAAAAWALAPAALPAAPDDAAASPAEKARRGLDRVVSIRVERLPLADALNRLREKAGLNLVLDDQSIQGQFGWSAAQSPTPVDVDLHDVTARSALRAILAPYGLSFAVVGGEVVVTTEENAAARQMGQKVNVDLDNVPFAEALKRLSKETGANLAVDGRVSEAARSPVTLRADDLPLETAVRLLAEMAGLKPVRVGNTLFVTSKAAAAELRNDPDLNAPAAPVSAIEVERLAERRRMMVIWQINAARGNNVAIPPQPTPTPPPAAPAEPPTIKAGGDDKPKADPPAEKKDGDK
jgi:hypothetical protein